MSFVEKQNRIYVLYCITSMFAVSLLFMARWGKKLLIGTMLSLGHAWIHQIFPFIDTHGLNTNESATPGVIIHSAMIIYAQWLLGNGTL